MVLYLSRSVIGRHVVLWDWCYKTDPHVMRDFQGLFCFTRISSLHDLLRSLITLNKWCCIRTLIILYIEWIKISSMHCILYV